MTVKISLLHGTDNKNESKKKKTQISNTYHRDILYFFIINYYSATLTKFNIT